mgnify:CR=1 FL=1
MICIIILRTRSYFYKIALSFVMFAKGRKAPKYQVLLQVGILSKVTNGRKREKKNIRTTSMRGHKVRMDPTHITW